MDDPKEIISSAFIPAQPGWFALTLDHGEDEAGEPVLFRVWREPIIAWEIRVVKRQQWNKRRSINIEYHQVETRPLIHANGLLFDEADDISVLLYPDGRVVYLYAQEYVNEEEWKKDAWETKLQIIKGEKQAKAGLG